MEIEAENMRHFGIKSYLDNFYDRESHDDQHKDLWHQYLISSHRPKFSSHWWKLLLWFGSFLVLFGFSLLLIGFFLPRKKINVDTQLSSSDSQVIIIDRQAIAYNTNLDRSHLFGICLVVTGGALFTSSLIMPTFCHMWCAASGDSNDETDPLKLRMEVPSDEVVLPVRSISKPIQPNYHKDESRLTMEGMVPLSSS
ncbi:unnamed protein product [Rotaria sp. Silwood2]|nr:unnamed protein product [Rotaria sp. Silwood2]CAF2772218.1 unnamed protein product [Rotaria sp. Silwood2]CAF3090984.1 unnamed protein product [Rotaria sp. Silwood2]CAF3178372.1 unnamed protein product [Rotaria sp. Silwood2]CAF3996070.1 unnamed protein product [Rotaria sp. Silwood2]